MITLGTDAFQIDYQASQGGVRVAGVFSNGLFEDEEGVQFRVANPLYSMLTEIARLNEHDDAQKKLAHFAALKTILPEDIAHSNINPETFLLRVRIAHVTAISLKPTIVEYLLLGHQLLDPHFPRTPWNPLRAPNSPSRQSLATNFPGNFAQQVNLSSVKSHCCIEPKPRDMASSTPPSSWSL
jgi:hypothetical protein